MGDKGPSLLAPQTKQVCKVGQLSLRPVALESGRPPQLVRPGLWLFAPSRESQGGSSWLLEGAAPALDGAPAGALQGDLLIDCPSWNQANLDFLVARPARGTIVLTGRDGHGRCRRFQEALDWEVWVQEQEAYLLPGVNRLRCFADEHQLEEGVRLLWTPGPSPGACVVHVARQGWDGLFCGRLLLAAGPGRLAPLRTAHCFHWPRQLASLERLRCWLPQGSPAWIASGGGLGALRGDKLVTGGAALLSGLDLEQLALTPVWG